MAITEISRDNLTGMRTYRFDARIAGKRHQPRVTCKPSEVKAKYRAWYTEMETKAARANVPMFFEMLDEYLEYSRKNKSPDMYRHECTVIEKAVKPCLGDMPLTNISRAHIERFKQWRREVCFHHTNKKNRISDATINRNLAVLSYFFNWARIMGYFPALNPCFKTKLRENNCREIRLTESQIDELVTKATAYDSRLGNIIRILLYTGLRYGELMNLPWNECDFDRGVIFLSRMKTKGKRARVIPMVNELRDLLLNLHTSRPISDLVIGASYEAIQSLWKRFRSRLSFETANDGPLHLHDIRHCTAQFLIDHGASMETVQTILGHQDVSTTQRRYAPLASLDVAEKVKPLGKIIPLNRASGE